MPTEYSGTREELDAISTERSIVVVALDGHALWLNSAAIALAGIPEPADEPLYPGATLRDDGRYDGAFIDFRWALFATKNILDQTPPDVLRTNILAEQSSAAGPNSSPSRNHFATNEPRIFAGGRSGATPFGTRGSLHVRSRSARPSTRDRVIGDSNQRRRGFTSAEGQSGEP